MSGLRGVSVLLLAIATSALAGCGAQAARSTGTTPSVAPTPTLTSTPIVVPTTAATQPAPTATPSGCPVATQSAIPDGTWAGPITMRVDGKGGRSGYASTRGTGTLRVVVANGTVTTGTWRVTWKSVGHADTGQAVASISLAGRIGGSVRGPATKPVLPATWRLHGIVTITKPLHATAPVDDSGADGETMKITSPACTTVTGTFLPSFNSKDAAATFTGVARWVGTRQG